MSIIGLSFAAMTLIRAKSFEPLLAMLSDDFEIRRFRGNIITHQKGSVENFLCKFFDEWPDSHIVDGPDNHTERFGSTKIQIRRGARNEKYCNGRLEFGGNLDCLVHYEVRDGKFCYIEIAE